METPTWFFILHLFYVVSGIPTIVMQNSHLLILSGWLLYFYDVMVTRPTCFAGWLVGSWSLPNRLLRKVPSSYSLRTNPRSCKTGTTNSTKSSKEPGRDGIDDVEPIDVRIVHPVFQLIGNLMRITDNDRT